MTESDAIQAQTAMLAGRLDTLNGHLSAIGDAITTFDTAVQAASGLFASALGGMYWIGYTFLGLVLAYVVLRVVWIVTETLLLRRG